MQIKKVCPNCKRELSLTSEYFHKSKYTRDGYSPSCKECNGYGFGVKKIQWTREEDELLQKYYPIMSNEDIAENYLPGRSASVISDRAIRNFKLKKNKGVKRTVKQAKWTEDEVEFLKENYSHTSNPELSDRFGNKTVNQVLRKARSLKLRKDDSSLNTGTRKRNLKKKIIWTDEDIALLRSYYPSMMNKEIAEKYLKDKTVGQIANKARTLKLYKNHDTRMKIIIGNSNNRGFATISKEWTEHDDKKLKELYPYKNNFEIAEILNRSRPAIIARSAKLGLKKQSWWTKEEESILKNNVGHTSLEELSATLLKTRSPHSIYSKAKNLGLISDVVHEYEDSIEIVSTSSKWWTQEEVDIVKKHYPELSAKGVKAKFLNERSESSIRKKAYELGVFLNPEVSLKIRDDNLKGRLLSDIENHPDFKNAKGLRCAARNRCLKWRKEVLKKSNKCELTGNIDNLVVHHVYPFSKIFNETLCDYESKYNFIRDNDLKTCIEANGIELVESFLNAVFERHRTEDGVVISKDLHDEFHNTYGTYYFTKEDFQQFKMKY